MVYAQNGSTYADPLDPSLMACACRTCAIFVRGPLVDYAATATATTAAKGYEHRVHQDAQDGFDNAGLHPIPLCATAPREGTKNRAAPSLR